jgi:tetratricopeptide (TPR) repeat protein
MEDRISYIDSPKTSDKDEPRISRDSFSNRDLENFDDVPITAVYSKRAQVKGNDFYEEASLGESENWDFLPAKFPPTDYESLQKHLTGEMTDLEEAIEVARRVVESTPYDHPDQAGYLNNLGVRLSDRYSRTGAIADLEEAIMVGREVIHTTPKDYPYQAGYLNNLGVQLGNRFWRTGMIADLEEAIRVGREVVNTTPEGHPDRVEWLSNLGVRLSDRFSRTRAMADLEEAIRVRREVIDTTPKDHPDRAE